MTPVIQCASCRHFQAERYDGNFCSAFPDPPGIPWEIIDARFLHNKRHPAQKNDIVFEPREGHEWPFLGR